MAIASSYNLALGTAAPAFNLPDTVSGKMLSLESLRSEKATVIMFLCNHCPYVKHVNPEVVRIANEYIPKGISFIGISSNEVAQYPEDGPEQMKRTAKALGYSFPYLYDETQDVARAYDAVCTPDFYVFDKKLRLIYHGQLDNSRASGHLPRTGKDLRSVLQCALEEKPVSELQRPSIGCSIKWKKDF
ncbi:MAG TPA: thioredoxin family protein [Bacteroidia bacterium]|nr:thioredoxin family protein [Bacteroidia bacterium]